MWMTPPSGTTGFGTRCPTAQDDTGLPLSKGRGQARPYDEPPPPERCPDTPLQPARWSAPFRTDPRRAQSFGTRKRHISDKRVNSGQSVICWPLKTCQILYNWSREEVPMKTGVPRYNSQRTRPVEAALKLSGGGVHTARLEAGTPNSEV